MSPWLQILTVIISSLLSPLAIAYWQRSKRREALDEATKRVEFWSKWLSVMRDANAGVLNEGGSAFILAQINDAAKDMDNVLNPPKGKRHLSKWRRWLMLYKPDSLLASYLHIYPYFSFCLVFYMWNGVHHIYLLNRLMTHSIRSASTVVSATLTSVIATSFFLYIWAGIVKDDGRD